MSSGKPMSGAARSIFVWGIYMMVSGTCFMLMPNVILPLLKFDVDHEPWVVVGASLIAILGYYYIVAAKHELRPFFHATIYGRIALLGWFLILIVMHKSRWEMLFLGVPDQFGALWTYLELKKSEPAPASTTTSTPGQ
jgi:hypothetical protein